MGAWGTGISSNDVYEDIYYEFFELYNQGLEVPTITEKIIADNPNLIDSYEDHNNFWITIAKAQWECKSLDPQIFHFVKDIVESDKDTELWKELGASKSDINNRRKALHNFLNKISTEKKTARRRKSIKLKDAVFEKGDCLVFKLSDGDYCGVFVLEAERQSESGLNLVAVTDIKNSEMPTESDFRKANVLYSLVQQIDKKYRPIEKIGWYFADTFKRSGLELKKVANLAVKPTFDPDKDFKRFASWKTLKSFQDAYYSESYQSRSDKTIKLNKLRRRYWLQQRI